MGVTINEEKIVTVYVSNEALVKGETYVLLMENGDNMIGIYNGMDRGLIVFEPILGDRLCRVRCNTLKEVKKLSYKKED